VNVSTKSAPPLEELTTEQFRQQLAGLIDPREEIDLGDREDTRLAAIDFVACLPQIFGESLNRLTLWNRIGTAIETAYAKTVADDVEFFISEVCRQIQAGSAAARSEALARSLTTVSAWEIEKREAWLNHLATRLPTVLVYARMEWEKIKSEQSERARKRKGETAQ